MERSPFLRRLAWIATAVYWAVLFILTHIPGSAMPDTHVNDKLAHFTAYGLLAALLFVALSAGKPRRMEIGVIILLIGIVYGAIDEWLQALPFVRRDCELADWTADVSGVAMAVVLASLVRMWLMTRRGTDDSSVL